MPNKEFFEIYDDLSTSPGNTGGLLSIYKEGVDMNDKITEPFNGSLGESYDRSMLHNSSDNKQYNFFLLI